MGPLSDERINAGFERIQAQLSDMSAEFGGPIRMDRAWFFASYSAQDIRLVRRAGALVDRTPEASLAARVSPGGAADLRLDVLTQRLEALR